MGVCLSSVKPSDSLYLFILRMESPADFVDAMAMARSQHRSDDGLSRGGGVGGHRLLDALARDRERRLSDDACPHIDACPIR